MKEKRSNPSDKRRYARFPVGGFVGPITLRLDSQGKSSQPAVLTDLSAGGISLVTFIEPPHSRRIEMILSLPGLKSVSVEGKVARVMEKGQTYKVGISFTKIEKKHKELINNMALDNQDCDIRVALKLPEACVPDCRFHHLCAKPQKALYWKK